MKDLKDILRRMAAAEKAADSTHESCTGHAQRVLSKQDYQTYLILMSGLTDLMADMASAGKIPVFCEILASLNRIMEDGAKMQQELNAHKDP